MKRAGSLGKVWVTTTDPDQETLPMPRVRFTLPQSLPRARYGVCIAHVRKWVWNRLREIDGWDWCRSRIWRLMTELSKGDG